jgi:hypothetical protein
MSSAAAIAATSRIVRLIFPSAPFLISEREASLQNLAVRNIGIMRLKEQARITQMNDLFSSSHGLVPESALQLRVGC